MSDKAQQLFNEAMQASRNGDTSRATDLLKQVVDEDPENIAAWEALSRQLTDTNERRMALTTVLQLDPDNEYARNALESVEKPKGGLSDNAELVPGIPMRQAQTVGIGLVLYTLLVCGATLFITSAINNNRIAAAQKIAQEYAFQTETRVAGDLTATQVVIVATQQSADATATKLVEVTPTATATATRAFELPTEIPASPTATGVSFRVADVPPSLPGRVLAWGGDDVRSKEYLPLLVYRLSSPGISEPLNRELGRNPVISPDNTTTVFEQWRSDAPRLYMSSLEAFVPGASLDPLLSNQYLIVNLRDPSVNTNAKLVAFIATDYNTKVDGAYVADVTTPTTTKVYKLSQDAASYTGITLSPDGTKAVAVRTDGGSTDLVVFDLTNMANFPLNIAQSPPSALEGTEEAIAVPTATTVPVTIPLRPLTTDGNALIEGSPSFSPDGTRIVYEAYTSSAPANRDLYIITVGAGPGTPQPIMTTDGNDIFPSFSPDGNMVVFASDRVTGVFNLYIYDTTSLATYQLSEEPLSVYPGSWVN